MITASHNENGWTGIKMGIEKGLTHCKEEMSELKNIVLNKKFSIGKGSYKEIKNFNKIYIDELSKNKIKKKFKAVVAAPATAIPFKYLELFVILAPTA